jgi:hypothetical protein
VALAGVVLFAVAVAVLTQLELAQVEQAVLEISTQAVQVQLELEFFLAQVAEVLDI